MKRMAGIAGCCLLLVWGLVLFCGVAKAFSPEQLGLGLVDVAVLDPSIVNDVKYATAENFTGQVLYPSSRCLLREPVARRLLQVQRNLRAKGLGLKVFDCYRPVEVQRKMWAIYPDENYVADPASGSRHNRGASVDVGLVDPAGRELPMPSGFDEFSERSHLSFLEAPSDALRNRQILQTAMRQSGFLPVSTEWWHFDSPDWKDYGLSDVDTRIVPSPEAFQVLVVPDPVPGSVQSTLWTYEKTPRGWERALGPIPVTVGRQGIALFDKKREGDGMTPRGVFSVGPVFGYDPAARTRMPYRQVMDDDAWIDDPASPRYNRWVKGIPTNESHERMRRADGLYRLGVVVGYNTEPVVSGRGSAIFLHVWKGPAEATAGCVAMSLSDLQELLAWLDPGKKPQIILGFQGASSDGI